MEGHCSTGQNPQWPVVPMDDDEDDDDEEEEEEEEGGGQATAGPALRVPVGGGSQIF